MQPYKDHMPIGDAEELLQKPEEMQQQLKDAFLGGADEIKIFKPTPEQLKKMQNKKKIKRKMAKESRKINRRK